MLNYKELEELRTKEELINYFKVRNINLTNEEIENLKQQYKTNKNNNKNLTYEQLTQVAGGLLCGQIESNIFSRSKLGAKELVRQLTEIGRNSWGKYNIHASIGENGSVNLIVEDSFSNARGIEITKVDVTKQGEIQLTGKGKDGSNIILSFKQLDKHTTGYSRTAERSSDYNIFSQGDPKQLMSLEDFFNQPGQNNSLKNITETTNLIHGNQLERDFVALAELAGQRNANGNIPQTFSFNGNHGGKWNMNLGGWNGLIDRLNTQVPESNILNKEFHPSTLTNLKHAVKEYGPNLAFDMFCAALAAGGITGFLKFCKWLSDLDNNDNQDNTQKYDQDIEV